MKLIIQEIIKKEPEIFIEKKCLITYDDNPFPKRFYKKYDLSFSTTKIINKKYNFLPIPCPYFTGWSETGLKNSDDLIQKFINNNIEAKKNKIFWIGANTNNIRLKLQKLSYTFPHILEIMMMDWGKNNKFVSLENHLEYKYLIDAPRAGYSARIKWLLASGRPLFIIERKIIENWHDKMTPMEHFIPVKEDLSDLIEKYNYLESKPDLYKKISKNAKDFAKNNLFLKYQIERTINKIKKYEK